MPTQVLITGSKGRMGQALLASAKHMPEIQVSGQVDQGDDYRPLVAGCDAVIDFSFHEATAGFAEECLRHHKALVIGTTGHTEAEKARLHEIARNIPVVWASNYSTGVNALFWLTRQAARILGPDFDLEVVEMHHRMKKDAPSGTAESLVRILAEQRQLGEDACRHGRAGLVGARTPHEIGVHALRGGDVVGDHTVIFAALGERVELSHKASSRETFARGALRAAAWVVAQPAGLYDMQDVLGLKRCP